MKNNFEYLVLLIVGISVFSQSVLVDRLAVVFILSLCIYWGRQEKSFFNPYNLFAFAPFSLLVYINVSSNFMVELTHETWVLAIINFVAFIFGLHYTREYKGLKHCTGPADSKLVTHTWIFTALGLVPAIFEYLMGQPFFLASILKLCSVPAIICAIKSKERTLLIIVLLLFVGSAIGFLSKSAVLQYVIAVLIGIEKYRRTEKSKKISPKLIVALSLLGVFIMVLSFTFAIKGRESRSSDEVVEYYRYYGNVDWKYHNALFLPYMYLTTPWANLQYVTDTQNSRTYGLWLIRPFLGYAQIDDVYLNKDSLEAYSSFNTFTFIAPGFKDFGYWLSVITSLFLGFFVKKVYSRFKLSKSPLDVACYALVGLAVLEMFFSNVFLKESYPFTIVIIMGIYKYVFFWKKKPQLEKIKL